VPKGHIQQPRVRLRYSTTLKELRAGDTLGVSELPRLGRSMAKCLEPVVCSMRKTPQCCGRSHAGLIPVQDPSPLHRAACCGHATRVLLFALSFLGAAPLGWAWQHETLSGELGGYRSRLADRGVTLDLIYTGEMVSILSGGVRRKTVYLDSVDLTLTLDVERLLGWPGARVFVYGLGNRGGNPSRHVGDAQGVSGIEAFDTWKLYEAWFEQQLFDARLSLLVGLYNLEAEFDYAETGQLFLHSSFGTGPDFSLSGQNGPSVFPTTSLGVRLRLQPDPTWYWQTAVLDGVAGDPDDPGGTQVVFGAHDGVLVASELAYLIDVHAAAGGYGKYALGAWVYSDGPDDGGTAGRAACCGGAYGLYGLAEQVVYRHVTDPRRGLALFARLGFAEARVNPFSVYTGGGLVYTGLLSWRPEDRCGLGIAAAHHSGRFRRTRHAAGHAVADAEIALELTYRAGLTAWWTVQPSLQYIVNPGTEPGLDDAVLVGLRFEVVF